MPKRTEQLKSLAFDVYIYSNGKSGSVYYGKSGSVYCRQTKEQWQFNDYEKEKEKVLLKFIDKTKKEWFRDKNS